MDTFHERLKQLRLEKKKTESKYTQDYFAKKIGVARTTYTAYENGTKNPPMDTIIKLANCFNVTVDYLTGKSDQKEALTEKDKKNISKRLEQLKDDIETSEGLSFFGEPLSEDAKQSILSAMEYALTISQKENKKFTPNKYRK